METVQNLNTQNITEKNEKNIIDLWHNFKWPKIGEIRAVEIEGMIEIIFKEIMVNFFPIWWKLWRRERLKAGGEGDNRGWDGWMASPTQWT